MSNNELLAIRELGVNGMYICLKPKIPVVITPGLVQEIRRLQNSLAEKYLSQSLSDYFYVVWFLEKQRGLSCHGLDFNFLLNCIKNNKETELEFYIEGVFNLIFLNHIGLGFPIINCSIVTRALTGLSKEFFFLNKICFIQNSGSEGIKKVSITNEFNPLLFQKNIYEKNQCYSFDSIRLDKMRSIIENVDYEIPTTEEVNQLKEKFEAMKDETISRIYQIALKDIKILERMAKYDLKLCA